MQIHQLKPTHKNKNRKRVGRGGKRGTYSGRGLKGQRARAGRKMPPAIREFIKKYPKLRGYRVKRFAKNIIPVKIELIKTKFNDSEIVSPKTLLEKRIIRRIKGKIPKVKIIGKESLGKKLSFENCLFSELAKKIAEKEGSNIINSKSKITNSK